MQFIKGVSFAPFANAGCFRNKEAFESLKNLKERTGANFIILVPNGLQENACSEDVNYTSKATMEDDELERMILYAKEIGLRVALKPTVNCMNGTWRAYINFFDEEVHCEPKWSNWFRSYTDFQLHYARIAEKTGCEMFIVGCEMIMAERREAEWRKLIKDVREVYHGLISYNTDKYQEHNVKWWDAVDVISSSGYYPIDDWERELDRIEKVVQKYQKPFFFAEIGCMSTKGSSAIPNNCCLKGNVELEEQARWYQKMFEATLKREWLNGFAIWEWSGKPYSLLHAKTNGSYEVYGKPAETVIRDYFSDITSE